MARKPARKRPTPSRSTSARSTSSRSTSAPANPAASERDRIIAAFMALLAEKRIEEIGFAEIAARADVSLSALRGEFASTLAIFAAQMKAVDREVLADIDADMAEEPPRERLFDVLMRRLDALEPHRDAVRSLTRSAARNPGLALALNALAVRSMQWMLTAADIAASGPKGMVRAQGLALLFASVLRTWVSDDDEGHAPTMATLDRALARGQRLSGFLDDLCAIPACASRFRSRRRRGGADEEPVAA